MSRAVGSLLLGLVLFAATLHQGARGWQRLEASRLVWQAQQGRAAGLFEPGRARAGKVEHKLEALRRAQALDPLSIEALALRADLLLVTGDLEGAGAVYRQGLRLEPRPELYFNLGSALWATGQDEEALEAFRRSVALDFWLRARVPPELLGEL